MRYVCKICGYIYDDDKQQVPFAELPDTWVCPLCGAAKSDFAPEEGSSVVQTKSEQPPKERVVADVMDEDMIPLSIGQISAVCSNLARGCEKQYKQEEAGLFKELADYFAEITPAVPEQEVSDLLKLLKLDLEEQYQAVNTLAKEKMDRGAQRVCVWGEKVSMILNGLLSRYEREGESFLANTAVWICTVCGFVFVGDSAPETCPVCKVPSWKFEKVEGRKRV